MGRKTKDFWNWTQISIPYSGGKDSSRAFAAEKFLENELGYDGAYEVRVTTEYPKPRTRYSMKVVTAYHYYIEDKNLATMFALRWA